MVRFAEDTFALLLLRWQAAAWTDYAALLTALALIVWMAHRLKRPVRRPPL